MSENLKDAFHIELATREFKRLIPRRRSGDYSLPLTLARKLPIDKEFAIGDELLHKFGLDEFVGASNAEPTSRPIPEVFRTSDTDVVTAKVVPELPALYRWLTPQVVPPWQSFNEVSRMGAPFYKPYDDKKWILRQLFPQYYRGDFSMLDGHVIQIGVRVQNEKLSKKRNFTYITDDGEVYKKELDRSKDKVLVWGRERYPGRARPVFNQGLPNLCNQFVDTAFNDVYGKHPAFHHDMTTAGGLVRGPVLAFDVSHMERLTARIVFERAKVIGGVYQGFQTYLRTMPFLVPSDSWGKAFKLTCNYDAGWMVQFGSGNSAVAPSQKDIFMILYRACAHELLGIPIEQGFDWVAQGGDDRLRIFNFGDDNFVFSPRGDVKLLQDVFQYMSLYLTVGIEDPPKFLGHEFDGHTFRLAISSYLLKTYQNERGPIPPFRRYPNLGWVEKRKHYTTYGYKQLPQEVFPLEDTLLKANGTGFADVLTSAAYERVALDQENVTRREYFTSPAYLLGKQDYAVDHETKVKVGFIGGYTGFTPGESAPVILNAVGKEIRSMFRFQ